MSFLVLNETEIYNANFSEPYTHIDKETNSNYKLKIKNDNQFSLGFNRTSSSELQNTILEYYDNIHFYLLYVEAVIILSISLYILLKSKLFRNIILSSVFVFLLSWISNNFISSTGPTTSKFYVCSNPGNYLFPIGLNSTCETLVINKNTKSSSSKEKQSFKVFNDKYEIQYEDDRDLGVSYIRSIYDNKETDTNKCFIDYLWKNENSYGFHLQKADFGEESPVIFKNFINWLIGSNFELLITCPKQEMDINEIIFTTLYLIFEIYGWYNLNNFKTLVLFLLISGNKLTPSYVTLCVVPLIINYLDSPDPIPIKAVKFLKISAFVSCFYDILISLNDYFYSYFDQYTYNIFSAIVFSTLALYSIYYTVIVVMELFKGHSNKWIKRIFILFLIIILKGYISKIKVDQLEEKKQL